MLKTCALTLFVLHLALSSSAAVDPRGFARPGEIATERVFAFAMQTLSRLYDVCLASSDCQLTPQEKTWLINIRQNMPKEILNPLQFESGNANSGRFLLDGNFRVAVTGNDVGSKIFLNTDFFYKKDDHSEWHPAISLEKAVIILTHELGHHLGVKDHQSLDALGVKVAMGTRASFSWIEKPEPINAVDSRNTELSLGVLQKEPSAETELLGAQTHLFFRDERFYIDLDPILAKELRCPQNEVPLRGYKLMDFRWTKWSYGGLVSCRNMQDRTEIFTIRAKAILNCGTIISDALLELPFIIKKAECPDILPVSFVLLKLGPVRTFKESPNFN